MNEQIKKWAVMANPNCQGAYDEANGTFSWTAENLEKFAKIVKDACVDAAKSSSMMHCRNPYDTQIRHATVEAVRVSIKDHIDVQ